MKMSRRAQRMERRHERRLRMPGFNIISLMDIFTILVFFLLVNSGEGEVLPGSKSVELPESIAEQKPRQNLVVMVTERDILVQGHRVALVDNIKNSDKLLIPPLKAALRSQNKRRLLETRGAKAPVPEITIMGNKQIPYRLLKKVMATCTDAGFGKISLAVIQKTVQES